MIRVFVVDDSAVVRAGLRQLLRGNDRFAHVGDAANGRRALELIPKADPDVVLMDIVMPDMDGVATTRELMRLCPKPILIVSELVGRDAHLNFRVLGAGALDLIRKPTASEIRSPAARRRLLRRIQQIAEVPVVTRRFDRDATSRRVGDAPASPTIPMPSQRGRDLQLVCVGASTGGPPALHELVAALGPQVPFALAVVQHMTPGFTEGLVDWLAKSTGVPAVLARDGIVPEPGCVYVAPDRKHLVYTAGTLRLRQGAANTTHCPSVDTLFQSVARAPDAAQIAGVLMTGMGDDGAQGLAELKRAGAWTIAQDEATSAVYGMPKAALALDAACEQLPLAEIAPRLLALAATRPQLS